MRYLSLLALGLLCSGCVPNPDVLVMKDASDGDSIRDTVYLTNGKLASQEISAMENGVRVNVWRYYENGVLTREDVDTNLDGIIDSIRLYDPKSGLLVKVMRDTNFDGAYDKQTEYDSNGRPDAAGSSTIYPRAAAPAPKRAPDMRRAEPLPDERLTPTSADMTPERDVNNGYAADANVGYDVTEETVRELPPVPYQESTAEPLTEKTPASGARRYPARLDTILSDDNAAGDTSALEYREAERIPAETRSTTPVDGALIQRITPPSRLPNLAPAQTSGVVPDATFQHPSAGLEE